ncbi:hypothetical protein FQN60_006070 [Etheostoma spectabile]|uniref:Uncharacterized protein n=1 Tax=Etheostoma spectabile TaxID=54343 RepID=A0A5J5C9Q4_9PERO|nr:hypothetical protein FQN60_006070 [Etheostoma spectabile]
MCCTCSRQDHACLGERTQSRGPGPAGSRSRTSRVQDQDQQGPGPGPAGSRSRTLFLIWIIASSSVPCLNIVESRSRRRVHGGHHGDDDVTFS